MGGLKYGPDGLEELLKERADYLNIPKVGHVSNVGFPTQQVNLAGAVEADDGM